MTSLLIRADANTRIGTGHVMRCLALAQAWQAEGGCALFLSQCDSAPLRHRVETAGVGFIPNDNPHPDPADLQKTLALLDELGASWLVLDGYHFDPTYQQAVRAAGHRLLVVDDTAHWPQYHADILLNQNINAEQLSYVCDADTRRLLGTRYVLLRPEFLAWRDWQHEVSHVARKVLVTLGGSDPDNVTLKVIQALQQVGVPELDAKIIVGPANPHLNTLCRAIESLNGHMQLLTTVTNMPELMAWADMAISAAGSTCWELAFMGLPSVLLLLAENQCAGAKELSKRGVALNLGWHGQVEPAQIAQVVTELSASVRTRTEMASQGQNFVDGDGIDRVLMRMCDRKIRLRRVREKDCGLLWEWANDLDVRKVSFSSEPIAWHQHLKWFNSKLHDPNCVFYIAVDEDETSIGQVRYDVNEDEAVISVSLDARFRGRRYGTTMIALASQKLYRTSQVKLIHSYIKPGNEASTRAFLKAGFEQAGTELVHGHPAMHLILPKQET